MGTLCGWDKLSWFRIRGGGKKGVNGTYDDNGKWITFTARSGAGPVQARGNHYSDHRGWISADLPTDKIITRNGTDRGKQTTNTRTGVTVGNQISLTDKERANYRHYNIAKTAGNANWDATDFADIFMPNNAIGQLGGYLYDQVTGRHYQPSTAKSGFNPWGLAKDMSQGNALSVGLRGFDTWSTLGAPGATSFIDKLVHSFAPYIRYGTNLVTQAYE